MIHRWAFGDASLKRLLTCDPGLIAVAELALEQSYFDFMVVCGHRTREDQEKAFAEGKSQKHWPDGNHNSVPSKALDFAPWPNPYSTNVRDMRRWLAIGQAFYGASLVIRVQLRFGWDWDGDRNVMEQTFDDLGHVEIVGG